MLKTEKTPQVSHICIDLSIALKKHSLENNQCLNHLLERLSAKENILPLLT